MESFIALVFFGLAIAFYFLPSLIASSNGHRYVSGIALLNLFLGWTLIGWVIALVWAVCNDRPVRR